MQWALASFVSVEERKSAFVRRNEHLDKFHVALDGSHEVSVARFFFAPARMFEAEEMLRETDVLAIAHRVIHGGVVSRISGPPAAALAPISLIEGVDGRVDHVDEQFPKRALQDDELFLDDVQKRHESG